MQTKIQYVRLLKNKKTSFMFLFSSCSIITKLITKDPSIFVFHRKQQHGICHSKHQSHRHNNNNIPNVLNQQNPSPMSSPSSSSATTNNNITMHNKKAVHVPQPAYVEFNQTKKIKNYVNVHKDSLRVVVDEFNLDSYLVSFTFDALVDGSFTIFYFAKEGVNCTFMPVYPEIYMPRLIPFKKGLCQKFCQQSGTGIDLGFFELDHLSNPSPNEDIFPLVISAEASLLEGPDPVSPQAQITQAVLKKTNGGQFQAKVIKQILWVDSVRYELKEIYAIGNSDNVEFDNDELGKECIICMTLPMNITCLPCRHMCLCSKCAKDLRLQSNECPICRQPIEVLVEVKINKVN